MAANSGNSTSKEVVLSTSNPCVLVKWKVAAKQTISQGSILAVYKMIRTRSSSESELIVLPKLKSDVGGLVRRLLVAEGEQVLPGQAVLVIDVCAHKTVMKDMCAECGADLRREPGIPGNLKEPVSASIALVHNIPELRVSQEEAEVLAKNDKKSLLQNKKLVLLVDLDQTLIHTTTENVPPDMKDVYHFQLYGQNCWYHTKFRPGWQTFLRDLSNYYELHIFTMGSRMYAHTIARMLDPNGELFADRIRSRDESFSMFSKYRDLSALFPCDDSMVCIIDDREDIWDCAPNLVTVKPYRFFEGTGDINAPPGSNQTFTHPSAIPVHEEGGHIETKVGTDGIAGNMKGKGADGVDQSDGKKYLENESISGNVKAKEACTDSEAKCTELNHVSEVEKLAEKSVADVQSAPTRHGSQNAASCKNPVFETTLDSAELGARDGSPIGPGKCIVEEPINGDKAENGRDSFESTVPAQHPKANLDGAKENIDKGNVSEGRTTESKVEEAAEVGVTETNGKVKDEGEGCAMIDGLEAGEVLGDSKKACASNNHDNIHTKNTEVPLVDNYHTEDHDDYLLYLEEILRRVHQRFYEILDQRKNNKDGASQSGLLLYNRPDLRLIVPELRCNVLKGTNVVFTGVIPTNSRHEDSQAWRIAKQFGANVTRELMTRKNTADRSKRTTHVIAARPGTEKACQAMRLPNVKLVNPNWLWTCAERWEWVDERLFPVEDYEEYRSRKRDTPSSSRRGTPKEQVEDNERIDSDRSVKTSFGEQGDFLEYQTVNPSERFREALNPVFSFSSGEMEAMDKEVEDLMRSSEGEDDDDDYEDQGILGSVSSSSGSAESRRNSVDSMGSSRVERDFSVLESDGSVDEIVFGSSKGRTIDFSTIKQTVSKRRKLELYRDYEPGGKKMRTEDGDDNDDDDDDDAGTDAEFSSDEDSSTSPDEDDDGNGDGNDMAAMLEAAIYHS